MAIAVETTSTITIDTGAAVFVVQKTGCNIIDSVVVGGVSLVATGHAGAFELIDDSDVVYSSIYDTPVVTITQNGPVKAIVKIEGRFKRTDLDPSPFGYIIWMTFYLNSTSVRFALAVHNAYYATYSQKKFNAIRLSLPTALSGAKTFEFPTSLGTYTGTISTEAYMYQGYEETPAMKVGDWYSWEDPPRRALPVNPAAEIGCRVQNAELVLQNFSGNLETDYVTGWAEMRNATHGVTVSYRDMAQYFPASIEFTESGVVRVGLYSTKNSRKGLVFDWATRESRDILIDFHASAVNAEIHANNQYPLFGRAPFEYVGETGAIMGRTRLATYDEQRFAFAAGGRTSYERVNVARDVWRYWIQGAGGSYTQRDNAMSNALGYLQGGKNFGGFMLNAWQHAIYRSDQYPQHSYDFDYGVIPYGYDSPTSFGSGINGGASHQEAAGEHAWTQGLLLMYQLTGDERFSTANAEIYEAVYFYSRVVGSSHVFGRRGSSETRSNMLAYLATGLDRYLTEINRRVMTFINTIDLYPLAQNWGRSLERGFHIGASTEEDEQLLSCLFTSTYHGAIWRDVLSMLPSTHVFTHSSYPGISYTMEDLRAAYEGTCQFIVKEMISYPSGLKPWAPYTYDALDFNNSSMGAQNVYDGVEALAAGYESSGDQAFLDPGARWAAYVYQDQYLGADVVLGVLDACYAISTPTSSAVQYVAPTVIKNGVNDYTLRWYVPVAGAKVTIKYASKIIVPNLNFEKTTRVYEFDPSLYCPFWAATLQQVFTETSALGALKSVRLTGTQYTDATKFAIRYNREYTRAEVVVQVPVGPGWYPVVNTKLADVTPPIEGGYDYPNQQGNVTGAWNGAGWDDSNSHMYVFGGGHHDYPGNEVYLINYVTGIRTRLTDPTPYALCTMASAAYADGKISSRHIYGALCWLPSVEKMLVGIGYVWNTSGVTMGDHWLFDPALLTWTRIYMTGSSLPTSYGWHMHWDQGRGRVWMLQPGSYLGHYTPATGAWVRVKSSVSGSRKNYSVYVPSLDALVYTGGVYSDGRVILVYLDNRDGYANHVAYTTGAEVLCGAEAPGLAYDPVTGNIIGWCGGNLVYVIDPSTIVSVLDQPLPASVPWTVLDYSGGPPAKGNGTFSRFQYSTQLDAFVTTNSVNDNAYILRIR